MIRVYIASPYTKGDVALNVRNSLEVADKLISLGFAPYGPLLSHFQHLLFPKPYETWLNLDMVWLEVCSVVLRLPGESPGADKEVARAKELNIPIFYSLEELVAWAGLSTKLAVSKTTTAYTADELDLPLPEINHATIMV